MSQSFMEYLDEQYITEAEFAKFLGLAPERLRDLRSHHTQGKQEFIEFIKPSHKVVLYKRQDVIVWLNNLTVHSFGINKDDPDKEVSD